jgi:hypothetical protein
VDTTDASEPPNPPADTKDWTWVLLEPCRECGYDASAVDRDQLPDRIRVAAAALRGPLSGVEPGARPNPQVWSPLEYAAHVRDVCRIFGVRLSLMRGRDDPQFANWDQDETAQAERYWTLDPATVSAELADESERIATDFASVSPAEWDRTGRRSDGAVFTVDTLGRYLLHDLVHHVHDVTH